MLIACVYLFCCLNIDKNINSIFQDLRDALDIIMLASVKSV